MPERLELGHVRASCRATNPDVDRGYQTVLPSDERARSDRFQFARDRRDYANAHDLLRITLSLYDVTSPTEWRFDATPHGKPFLAPGSPGAGGHAPLTFNLSHTRELVACVIGRGTSVGIDVERVDRLHDVLGLATRFFSPLEVAGLHALDDDDRPSRFVELWTLKESFIKAIGKGLSQPLNSFTFDLTNVGTIRFTPPPEYACGRWHFAQYAVAPNVLLAIAASGERSPTFLARRVDREQLVELRPTRTTLVDS